MTPRKKPPKLPLLPFVRHVRSSLETLRATRGRILAAVSAGADSTALLTALHTLSRYCPIEPVAIHANHALRGKESEGDEQFLRDLAHALKIELVTSALPVSLDRARRDEGIELSARLLRLDFFRTTAERIGAKFVATAHTSDDQVETVLHRIVRGTALAGLAGIRPQRELAPGISLIRPMLLLGRSQVLEYLADIGQDFREDRSNRDLHFTRNRIRHRLIPMLIDQFNPRLKEAVIRLAQNAADAQAVIDRQVKRLRDRSQIRFGNATISLRTAALRTAPDFAVRELTRQLWAEAGWPLRELGHDDLDQVVAMVRGGPATCDLPHRVRAANGKGRLTLTRSS